MGTSAPPKNPPYQPIYPVSYNSTGEMLFPSAMKAPTTPQTKGVVRPALSKPAEANTKGAYNKYAQMQPQSTIPAPSSGATNPLYEQWLAYATKMLDPNLHRKG